MKEMREKGLCYHCAAKWNPGHKCLNSKLYLIEEVLLQPEMDTGQVVIQPDGGAETRPYLGKS